jgi:uncharacterized protein YjbJ (UPF0337 family)
MSNFKKDIKNNSDKLTGKTKEMIGKLSNDKGLELEGKVQATVADVKIHASNAKKDIDHKVDKFIHRK